MSNAARARSAHGESKPTAYQNLLDETLKGAPFHKYNDETPTDRRTFDGERTDVVMDHKTIRWHLNNFGGAFVRDRNLSQAVSQLP